MRRMLVSFVLVTAVTLSGCVGVSPGHSRGHGPPPHAPAHGYHAHHHGAELIFDSGLDVYVVVGHANHFYVDGRFLRLRVELWEASASLSGPWQATSTRSLPPGLARKKAHHSSKPHHPSHKKQVPGKGHW